MGLNLCMQVKLHLHPCWAEVHPETWITWWHPLWITQKSKLQSGHSNFTAPCKATCWYWALLMSGHALSSWTAAVLDQREPQNNCWQLYLPPVLQEQITVVTRCTSGCTCTAVLEEGGEKGSRMNKKTLSKIHNGEGLEDFCHKIVFPFAK